MSTIPSYVSLNSELTLQAIGITAAELHGFITGILAGGNQDESWRILLDDMMNDGKPIIGNLAKLILELYQQTKQQLNEDSFEFKLLISEDELFKQIDDMVGWVNHFLLGLGLAQPKLAYTKGDVGEAIYDLRQITQLGYDEDDEQEELAFAFEEIVEYVRMTVILCHDEFTESNQSTTLH